MPEVALAYPLNVANNAGATFSIMKSVSNNGQGPWLMEGSAYCPSTSSHTERDGLSSFSDFAVVQSDIGNYLLSPVENEFTFSVFPNPAFEKITLTFNSDASQKFTLYLKDVTGRVILRENITPDQGLNSLDVNIHDIAKGIYLLVLENEKQKAIEKLIVQ